MESGHVFVRTVEGHFCDPRATDAQVLDGDPALHGQHREGTLRRVADEFPCSVDTTGHDRVVAQRHAGESIGRGDRIVAAGGFDAALG